MVRLKLQYKKTVKKSLLFFDLYIFYIIFDIFLICLFCGIDAVICENNKNYTDVDLEDYSNKKSNMFDWYKSLNEFLVNIESLFDS